MTQAADSAARQVIHGESDRDQSATNSATEFGPESGPETGIESGNTFGDAPQRKPQGVLQGTSSHLPVFAAFVELGLTGRDVALLADVTPPTVSKWRAGKARIPDEKLAFLTLVLAHLLDDAQAVANLEAQCESDPTAWCTQWSGRWDAARAYLAYQDVLNRELAAGRVREGAQLFRTWWASGAAQRLQEKRFAPRFDGARENDQDTNDKVQNMRHMK